MDFQCVLPFPHSGEIQKKGRNVNNFMVLKFDLVFSNNQCDGLDGVGGRGGGGCCRWFCWEGGIETHACRIAILVFQGGFVVDDFRLTGKFLTHSLPKVGIDFGESFQQFIAVGFWPFG